MRYHRLISMVAVVFGACAPGVGPADGPEAGPDVPRTTFVLVHGAWGGGWDWWTVDSMLTSRGHRVERVTLTGLGERVHLADPDVNLDTHVTDVVHRILWERLDDVVLMGHSYGGVVVTGAADRVPDRVRRVVYVDAIIPEHGRSTLDVLPVMRHVLDSAVDGYIPASWATADQPVPRDVPHPLSTLTDTVRLTNGLHMLRATYILTEEPDRLPDDFQPFADRAVELGWALRRLETGHVPERTMPAELVELLIEAAAAQR